MKGIITRIIACSLFVLAGCSDNVGFLIKPVPADQRLKETVVRVDKGLVWNKVALIDVEGLLVNTRNGCVWSNWENPVSMLCEKLDKAQQDGAVKAVVIRINSPGGTVQASEAMYDQLQRFKRESRKPIVACITNVGASGAYYVACAADKIVCQPSSITGSIGVIIQTVNFVGTMKLLGIKAEAITSGPYKAMGSPLKGLTEKEREIFRSMVKEFYDQFIEVVTKGRDKLNAKQVRALADGRVFTGKQALRLGLVDRLGSVEDAIEQAKKAAGIKKAKVVMYHRPYGYRSNVYSAASLPAPATQINLLNLQMSELALLRRPMFLYLWSTDLTSNEIP